MGGCGRAIILWFAVGLLLPGLCIGLFGVTGLPIILFSGQNISPLAGIGIVLLVLVISALLVFSAIAIFRWVGRDEEPNPP